MLAKKIVSVTDQHTVRDAAMRCRGVLLLALVQRAWATVHLIPGVQLDCGSDGIE